MAQFSRRTPEQILSALRFFQLIDEQNRPAPILENFIKFPQKRPECMRFLLQNAYRDVMEQDRMKMTPQMLEVAMERYHLSEKAKRDAVPFFLHAAKYAGLRLPRMLLRQVRNSGPRCRSDGSGYARTHDSTVKRATKQVQLRSGGSVTLVIDADVFSIQGEDRDFVFELVDRIRKYQELISNS